MQTGSTPFGLCIGCADAISRVKPFDPDGDGLDQPGTAATGTVRAFLIKCSEQAKLGNEARRRGRDSPNNSLVEPSGEAVRLIEATVERFLVGVMVASLAFP